MSQDRFTAAEVGKLLARPGLTDDAAHLRVKNAVADNLIYVRMRSETDRRRTALFSLGDALTAAVLGSLTDLGLPRVALQAAATRLQTWRFGETPGVSPEWLAAAQDATDAGDDLPPVPPEVAAVPESPAQWIMDATSTDPTRPPGFTLRLSWQRHESGHVNITASLSHGDFGTLGEGHEMLPDHSPVADLVMPLDLLALDLLARIASRAA